MPALDPDAELLLELGRQAARPPFEALTPEQARAAYALGWDALQLAPEDVASVLDQSIGGKHGPIPLRIYRGAGTQTTAILPCMLFLHGGGWVIGNLESHDRLCRRLANLARICVVAVDYRLAPEHRFPVALDDSASALEWLARNASELNIDSNRLAVGGDSAGGNLATVVALMARERGGPALVHQVLIYPVTDHDLSTPSYVENATGYVLTREGMRWFWRHYLAGEAQGREPYASPLRAPSLAGLPPALVITAEHDPLRDEGEAYATRLRDAGVPVTPTRYTGMFHGFVRMTRLLDKARTALDEIAGSLHKAFATRS